MKTSLSALTLAALLSSCSCSQCAPAAPAAPVAAAPVRDDPNAPPRKIPAELQAAYTRNGAIQVVEYYFNDSYPSDKPLVYTRAMLDDYIAAAKRNETQYYGQTDRYLFEAFNQFHDRLKGTEVAVMGSVKPWYESVVLAWDGKPVTIEYNKLVSEDPRLAVMTVKEYDAAPRPFDVVLSISSYEHDGLGRYGDPLKPDGDLEAMKKTLAMMRPGGLLFLAVPVGRDTIAWNAHRVYGRVRLPLLLEGWKVVASFGFLPSDQDKDAVHQVHQPVFVLTPAAPEAKAAAEAPKPAAGTKPAAKATAAK